tara:strand:+ start:660 stop:914 length:255 start_codon:yes stop_codon:yes gene_type:complete
MKKPIVKKTTAKLIKKVRPFAIPAAIFTAGAYAYGKTPMARKNQNMRIEMQAIAKDRKVRKISSSEIDKRLDKAKKSKREFTWI